MAAQVRQINIPSQGELESTVSSYIAQGFLVSNRTADTVTLYKKKEFNVVWAIIGFFLCILPLIIYLIVYSTRSDEMVLLKLDSAAAVDASGAAEITWSDDREWWWDGTQWRDARSELPPDVKLSEDGGTWWDGSDWHPVPSAPVGEPPEPPAESPTPEQASRPPEQPPTSSHE